MWDIRIKIQFAIFLLLSINTFAQQPKIIATIDPQKLDIQYSETDRKLLYSVLDSEKIILAVDKTLMFIENNEIVKNISSPAHIFAFDIRKCGNGVIVSNNGLYKIIRFQIQPNPIKSVIEIPKKGKVIWKIDMINDTIARFFVNGTNALFYINVMDLESNNYIKDCDLASKFISEVSNTYVGKYNDKYYFLVYDINQKSECLLIKNDFESNNVANEEVIRFGYLGSSGTETVPVRYDEDTGFFYEMLIKEDKLVLYRFDIKEFQ
jgi:hypothetical protein